MLDNEYARQLHDRTSRGQPLSITERAALNRWYEEQDQAESSLLSAALPLSDLGTLRESVARALGEVRELTEQVQILNQGNTELREKVDRLQRQLGEAALAKSA